MKLINPGFVNHEGNAIFSCDIHPDGLRFATGGQGTNSGRICIWNLKTVIDETCDNDENVPKCLCVLENHTHCVNAVRWSHSGKNLASGGDDKLIMIWVQSGESRLNAAGVPVGLEHWRCAHTLSSHEGDVLDLAWGPNDTKLATSSVDNTVIIWNMDGKPAVLSKLHGHTGFVKGVTWDPVGEYLASQSDDKSVRIWRTSDWKQQVAVTEPFKDCADITHILRLDWSPDGLYVVSAHACNSGGPTAQIIDRATDAEKKCWPSDMDFVGHRKAVTCVKFNKNLMTKPTSESKFCLVATGSRDCSIALWSTQQRRPIFAIKNCFKKGVVDMSWGLDGRVLMACSWEGSVMFFSFAEGELGVAVQPDEKTALLENIYGKSLVHGKVEPILEYPELLDVQPEAEAKKPAPPIEIETSLPPPVVPVNNHEPVVVAKQIEVKRADGRRRITPVLMPEGVQTKIVVEKLNEAPAPQKAVLQPIIEEPAVAKLDVSPPKRKKTALVAPENAAALSPYRTSAMPAIYRPPAKTVHLRALGYEGSTNISVAGSDGDVIVVENQKEPLCAKIRREAKKEGVQVLWETIVGHQVVALRSNLILTAVFCSDRSVQFFKSCSGTLARLPLLLPGYPACVDLTKLQKLCVVTTCGYVIVWDLTNNTQVMRDSTLKSELLSDPTAFTLCRLQENGQPLVILNNGRSFSYSAMGWQLLTDVKSPVWSLPKQKDFLGGPGMPYRGLVGEVKSSTAALSAAKASNIQSATTSLCSTSLMYQQLLACDVFGSEVEYKTCLLSLVKHLAQIGALPQLRDLLTSRAEPRGILKDCLNVMKGYLTCQRLYVEIAGPIVCVNEESLGPPNEMEIV